MMHRLLKSRIVFLMVGFLSLTLVGPEARATDICNHAGMKETLAVIRASCVDGTCDIDAMLKKIDKSIGKHHFLAAVSKLPGGVVFFQTGKTTLTAKEQEIAENNIRAAIGPMVENPENSVFYMIGKASKSGSTQHNRTIASKRVATVYRLVEKVRESGQGRCAQYYRSYVGEERFQITKGDAQKFRYGVDEQWKQKGKAKINDYLNQSVAFFVFPCFKQMCQYLKDVKKMGCQPTHPNRLYPECRDMLCSQ